MYEADFCCILEKAYAQYVKKPQEKKIAKLTQNRAFDFEKLEEIDRSTGKQLCFIILYINTIYIFKGSYVRNVTKTLIVL